MMMVAPLVFVMCFGDDGPLVSETYPVGDLLGRFKIEQIMQVVTAGVGVDRWNDRGGRGTLEFYPLTSTLVINQPARWQKHVKDILEGLRKAKPRPAK
jgi:hypothetical protein